MKKVYRLVGVAVVACLAIPSISFAMQQNTFTGTVTRIDGTQVTFMVGSAAIYTAQTQNVPLVRKFGSAMQFSEIIVGDKLEVKGVLRGDNSIAASYIRDMSLYVHTGILSGKVLTLGPSGAGFTMQSKQRGTQFIRTDSYTTFKKNGTSATLANMEPGMSVSVKGVWDRTNTDVLAKEVQATLRLVNIYFTGELVMRGDTALTVIGKNNAIYGIDVSKATLQNKNGKPTTTAQYTMGGMLRVWGKHISGSVQIIASRVKEMPAVK